MYPDKTGGDMNVNPQAGPAQALLQNTNTVKPADEALQDKFEFQNKIQDGDGEFQQERTQEVSKLGAGLAPIVPDTGVQVAALAQDGAEKDETAPTPRHAVQAYEEAAGNPDSRGNDLSGTV